MHRQHYAGHRQAELQRRNFSDLGKTVDDRRQDDKADVEKDRNAENKCGDGQGGHGMFRPQSFAEALGQRFGTARMFDHPAEHRAQADDNGHRTQYTAHTCGHHFHHFAGRNAAGQRHQQTDHQQGDKGLDLGLDDHQQEQYHT